MTDGKQGTDAEKPKAEPQPKPMPVKERTPGKFGPIPDTDRRDKPGNG